MRGKFGGGRGNRSRQTFGTGQLVLLGTERGKKTQINRGAERKPGPRKEGRCTSPKGKFSRQIAQFSSEGGVQRPIRDHQQKVGLRGGERNMNNARGRLSCQGK